MVQPGLEINFKHQVLSWYNAVVPMKYSSSFLGQYNLNMSDMREVIIQTSEPASTKEATKIMVNIINSTYAKSNIEQVAANPARMNYEEYIYYSSSSQKI